MPGTSGIPEPSASGAPGWQAASSLLREPRNSLPKGQQEGNAIKAGQPSYVGSSWGLPCVQHSPWSLFAELKRLPCPLPHLPRATCRRGTAPAQESDHQGARCQESNSHFQEGKPRGGKWLRKELPVTIFCFLIRVLVTREAAAAESAKDGLSVMEKVLSPGATPFVATEDLKWLV